METIKNVLEGLMQSLQDKEPAGDKPGAILKKVLSAKEREHASFDYFKKGTMGVSVDSSPWLYYFNLQKNNLLAKLCKQSKAIKDIRFRIGEINPLYQISKGRRPTAVDKKDPQHNPRGSSPRHENFKGRRSLRSSR